MNEQIQKDLDALAQQKEIFARDLSNATDQTVITALQGEIDAVDAKIAAKQAEAAQLQQQVEEKVAEAQAQVSQSFDSISFGGQTVALGELALNEPARQILQIYFTQLYVAQAEQTAKEMAALKSSYEAQITDAKAATTNLQKQYDALYETSNEQRKQITNLQAELDDMTTRRDAAAKELDDSKQEIARLNSQVEDLRTEIAVGAKAAVNVVTNTGGADLRAMMEQFNASKPAIYNLRWKDENRKTTYVANKAETGEEIEFGYLEKGKYREVSAEEAAAIAARFQSEQAAAATTEQAPADQASAEPAQTDGNADSPLVVPPIVMPDSQFQGSTDTTTGLPETKPSVEASGQDLEERVAALESRVAALEGKQVNGAAA